MWVRICSTGAASVMNAMMRMPAPQLGQTSGSDSNSRANSNASGRARCALKSAREDRLAELNVIAGVAAVAATPILHRAWSRGADVVVHGLIYGFQNSLLRDLECSIRRDDWMRRQQVE